MKKVACAKCGGAMKKMAKGGTMKTKVGSKSAKSFIAGIPNSGSTGPNYQGVDTMKKGGMVKKKYAKGGSSFGMLSVKAGVDNNPKPTAADRIAGAKMQKGGTTPRNMTINTRPTPKSKYVTAKPKPMMAKKGGSIKKK